MTNFIEDASQQLASAIRTSVREHRLEIDGAKKVYPLDDISIDYLDETADGKKVYSAYGQTLAILEVEFNDTGDLYSAPVKEDETVSVSVRLRVVVDENTDEVAVETEDIVVGGENG